MWVRAKRCVCAAVGGRGGGVVAPVCWGVSGGVFGVPLVSYRW